MNGAERKQFLQSQGIIPQDPDGLMTPDFSGGGAAPGSGSSGIGMVTGALKAYSDSMNGTPEKPQAQAPNNGDDIKERLNAMLTPEMLERLRAKAGMGGTGSSVIPSDPNGLMKPSF